MSKVKTILITSIFFSLSLSAYAETTETCPSDSDQPWSDCFGVKQYENGSKYTGAFREGKRHGKGMLSTGDGVTYLGEFVDDEFDGAGVLWMPGGMVYVGEFRGGKINGIGVLKATETDKHIGEFFNGTIIRPAVLAPKEKKAPSAPLENRNYIPAPELPLDHAAGFKIDIFSFALFISFFGFFVDITFFPPTNRSADKLIIAPNVSWAVLASLLFFSGAYFSQNLGPAVWSMLNYSTQSIFRKADVPAKEFPVQKRSMPRM
jgi:hypothetical protein